MTFLHQVWTWLEGVGPRMVGLASSIGGLLDWLVNTTGSNIVLTQVNKTQKNHDYVYAEFWRVVFSMQPR